VSASLRLIHGEDRYLVDDAVRAWRSQAQSHQLDVEVHESPLKLDALRRSVSEVPLLDPERSILVRDPPQLSSAARRGADSAEMLAQIVADRPPTTALCIAVHGKVATQNPVLSAVRRSGGTVEYRPSPKGRELRAWLEREIGARGLRLPPGASEHLVRGVGADLGLLTSELDKLRALAADRSLSMAEV